MAEDLHGAGIPLTLALDTRPDAMKRLEGQMDPLLKQVKVIPAISKKFDRTRITSSAHMADCLEKSGAGLAFMAHFNDLASTTLRRAAFGSMPDARLRGRLGGVYLRPQFLAASALSPNQALKKIGFRRLIQNGWLNPLLFFDTQLCELAQKQYPGAPIFPLADPFPENFHADRAASRENFNLPENKFVLLFYGGGYKRKGLHLVAEAMLKMSSPGKVFLLCAGLQPKDEQLARNLESLRVQGRAEIVNRYVTSEEEKQLFAACDAVLVPYIRHQGTSGILSRAAGAGKPVIVSDELLLAHLVRQYDMGLVFEPGNVPALKKAIEHIASASTEELARWQNGARAHAKTCSRGAFRTQLVTAVQAALAAQK